MPFYISTELFIKKDINLNKFMKKFIEFIESVEANVPIFYDYEKDKNEIYPMVIRNMLGRFSRWLDEKNNISLPRNEIAKVFLVNADLLSSKFDREGKIDRKKEFLQAAQSKYKNKIEFKEKMESKKKNPR